MAALVQTFPQQTPVSMMQGRPSSSSGYPSQQHQHSGLRKSSRFSYHATSSGYRGLPASGPVAPYAFTSTPQLAHANNSSRPTPNPPQRSDQRTSSAPVLPQSQFGLSLSGSTSTLVSAAPPPLHHASPSLPGSSSSLSLQHFNRTADDDFSAAASAALAEVSGRPHSTVGIPQPSSMMLAPAAAPVKPSPDRYRRSVTRVDSNDAGPNRVHHASAAPSGAGMASVGHLYAQPHQSSSSPSLSTYRGSSYQPGNQRRLSSSDDLYVSRPQNAELAKRYRRRSLGNFEPARLDHSADAQDTHSPHSNVAIQAVGPRGDSQGWQTQGQHQRPAPSHAHTGSFESVSSTMSTHSRPESGNDTTSAAATVATATTAIAATPKSLHVTPVPKQDLKLAYVPPRSMESARRNPSPLSRPSNLASEAAAPTEPSALPQPQSPRSPAAAQLAAVSQKATKKSKSKIRRAFSFGSASELRRASAQNSIQRSAATEIAVKRTSKYEEEMGPEQARIAEKQEAGGLGESIYSGQGTFFTGSTDNLSVSSTASSASLMLRKMGQGVKKGTRSLVGLFRPKSVIGVPAADGPVNAASAAKVSMVTVEAEREKVNVNLDPRDRAGGGTGYPKLERNSLEAKTSVDRSTMSSDTRSRRSIVGGERERADVLAAVKKGILKRTESNQSSPTVRAYDSRNADLGLPHIPHVNDSPRSSAPSTPTDDHTLRAGSGHRRTDSITIEGTEHDDYFGSMSRFSSGDANNSPGLPVPNLTRNITFSPRIQFHDTWTGLEYDRRGEIATCNRLTPMLAQQIKEELNSFKMEMEVHETSKVYTHFF